MTDDNNPYRSPPNSNSVPQKKGKSKSGDVLYGRLLTLATFTESVDAHLFRNELNSHGINVAVTNENSTALFGATTAGQSAAFTIEVMIMEKDAEAGLEIKERWLEARKVEKPADQTVSEWSCSCGETVDAGFEICWNCSSPFPSEGPE